TGVNTLTGEGLAEALTGADVVVDVSNSPSFEDTAVLEFFETSTRNILRAEAAAGVGHHVALSVVGTERLGESGYMRAKTAQEKLIKSSPIPYTIVHATQFFEFAKRIAETRRTATWSGSPTCSSSRWRRTTWRLPCARSVREHRRTG
ncbi:MAG TPA: NAD(P)H-binding protein, partial [Solirubrobacterales bacterium]|nr:NAD(P)H-binding protein [Solirubrobacterales bacterium]